MVVSRQTPPNCTKYPRESIKVLSDICLDCPVCGTHELGALCVKFQDPNVNDEPTPFFQVRR